MIRIVSKEQKEGIMWKKARWFIPLLIVLILVLIILVERAGREKLPTQELMNAEKAVAEAKEKEADSYAPDLFGKAQESLSRAKDQILEKKYK
jgi:flagellar biosynthesis/type III secretory pathway M-ring protein FliF/YscJ